MNNIMKRIILFLGVIFLTLGMYAQTVAKEKPSVLTLNGVSTDTVTFMNIQGEYDVSLQVIPALSGSGDSLHFSYIVYQSNSDDADAWTAITSSANVFTTTDSDALTAITDFKGLRLQIICTGVSTDTSTVQPYMIVKKHRKE
jgi:hypothetical protein